jgi:hypothetical protein
VEWLHKQNLVVFIGSFICFATTNLKKKYWRRCWCSVFVSYILLKSRIHFSTTLQENKTNKSKMPPKVKKYIFVNGVMKANPEYQKADNGSSPTGKSPQKVDQPLAVVCSMDDIQDATKLQALTTGAPMQLSLQTSESLVHIQEEEFLEGFHSPEGQEVDGGDIIDKLSEYFIQYEVCLCFILRSRDFFSLSSVNLTKLVFCIRHSPNWFDFQAHELTTLPPEFPRGRQWVYASAHGRDVVGGCASRPPRSSCAARHAHDTVARRCVTRPCTAHCSLLSHHCYHLLAGRDSTHEYAFTPICCPHMYIQLSNFFFCSPGHITSCRVVSCHLVISQPKIDCMSCSTSSPIFLLSPSPSVFSTPNKSSTSLTRASLSSSFR